MEGEYTGHVKDGKVHGVGVCVYTDGSRYQGDWKSAEAEHMCCPCRLHRVVRVYVHAAVRTSEDGFGG